MATGSIVARILSQYSDKGTKAAQKDIAGLGKKFDNFGKKATAAFAVGAAAAGAFAIKIGTEAVKAVMEDEKSQAILANSLRNTVGASDEAIASVEKYIGTMQMAAGVADTELRTALAQLTAATGDLGQAQTLMGLALDVSAGSGKDLSTVTGILSKAMSGNYTAIAKLGIKGLDAASLKGKNLNEVMGLLADTFKGAASASANTLEGQMTRVKLAFGEVLEQIGTFLLPYLKQFADVLINKVVPAVQAWIEQNGTNVVAMFKTVINYGVAFFSMLWDMFQFVAKNAKIFGILGAIIVSALFGLKVAQAVGALVTGITAIIDVMKKLRKASGLAAAMQALATGGASAAAGAAAFALALGGVAGAWLLYESKIDDNFGGEVQSEFEGLTTSAEDYTAGLGDLTLTNDKLTKSTIKLNGADAKQLALKQALWRLAKLGSVPTSEDDPIQLEAARLNLLKQNALGIEAMTNNMWALLEAQFANNKEAQRYADILAVINDNKISYAEIQGLAYKWGTSADKALAYIQQVTGINGIVIDKDFGGDAAKGWDKAKLALKGYLAELGAGNEAQTAAVEADLATQAALDAAKAAEDAIKAAEAAEQRVKDMLGELGLPGGTIKGFKPPKMPAQSPNAFGPGIPTIYAPTVDAASSVSTSGASGGNVTVNVNAGNVVGSTDELVSVVREGILAGQASGKLITLNSLVL